MNLLRRLGRWIEDHRTESIVIGALAFVITVAVIWGLAATRGGPNAQHSQTSAQQAVGQQPSQQVQAQPAAAPAKPGSSPDKPITVFEMGTIATSDGKFVKAGPNQWVLAPFGYPFRIRKVVECNRDCITLRCSFLPFSSGRLRGDAQKTGPAGGDVGDVRFILFRVMKPHMLGEKSGLLNMLGSEPAEGKYTLCINPEYGRKGGQEALFNAGRMAWGCVQAPFQSPFVIVVDPGIITITLTEKPFEELKGCGDDKEW